MRLRADGSMQIEVTGGIEFAQREVVNSPLDYDCCETPAIAGVFRSLTVLSVSTGSSSTCARCGAPFHCGRDDGAGCWCARLPPLDRVRYDAYAGCLCEPCLRAAIDAPSSSPRGSAP